MYQASGSRLMIRSAGLAVWPKKNQCHQALAKRASARASASPIGIVEHGEGAHSVGVIHRRPERDVAAAIVAGDREPLVPERPHQRHAIARHRALRVRLVVGSRGRLRRLAVAAQIRAHDGVPPGQQRRHPVPGDVRARMAVQQEHRRAGPAVPHPQHRLADIDPLQLESVEHVRLLPVGGARQSSWRGPGGVAERSNAPVLKTGVRSRGPRVRIPPPPLPLLRELRLSGPGSRACPGCGCPRAR